MRSYGYAYDPMNRMTQAIYGKPNAAVKITHNYNEWLSYDANGNIMTLNRNGISDNPNNLILIDDLDYEYANNNSNLLVKVTDATNNDAGFKNGINDQNNDFQYDANGNLIIDRNKGITNVEYNHLNLPVKVTFDNASNKFIEYLYTATGQKVEKKVRHQDSLSYTRYSQGFQYFDDVLQFFHTPEGYVKNTPTETGAFSFDYVYNYVDHLGNVRMSYAQDPQTGVVKIMEENHYYPFGLKHTNYAQLTKDIQREEEQSEKSIGDRPIVMPLKNPGYTYKFNGMELQSEFGVNVYDFGARNYDPALGRWMNIDPLAEKMRRHSPYNYAFNNPIYFIDPDGMEAVPANSTSAASGGGGQTTYSLNAASPTMETHNVTTTTNQSFENVSTDGNTKTVNSYTSTTSTDIVKQKDGNSTIVNSSTSQSLDRTTESFSMNSDGEWVSNNNAETVNLAQTNPGEGLLNGNGNFNDTQTGNFVADNNGVSHDHFVSEVETFVGNNSFGSDYSSRIGSQINSHIGVGAGIGSLIADFIGKKYYLGV